MVFLKEFLEKFFFFSKKSQYHKSMKHYPACKALMNSSIWVDTMNLGWFTVRFTRHRVKFPKKDVLQSLAIDFILASRTDFAEMANT